jgi:methionine-rich copper-binding protein CopC
MNNKIKIFTGLTVVCLILTLVIVFFITKLPSSGRFVEIGAISSNSSSKMKGSYSYFNGSKSHKVNLKKGEELTINYKSEVKEGTLVISILDSNNNIIKVLESNTSGKEKIKADSDTKYNIKIEGNKTKGSYEITWN